MPSFLFFTVTCIVLFTLTYEILGSYKNETLEIGNFSIYRSELFDECREFSVELDKEECWEVLDEFTGHKWELTVTLYRWSLTAALKVPEKKGEGG